MRPALSVVVPTMRVGGLDVLRASLSAQTCQDFELILVDAIRAWRPLRFGPDSQHVEPVGNSFPLNQYCRSANTGIRAARGDVVLLLVDYTWLSPTFVERHLRLHELSPNRVVLSPHRSVKCPALKPAFEAAAYRKDFEHYSNEGVDRYAEDVRSGALDYCAWSIFENPLPDVTTLPPEERFGGRDPKYDVAGPLPDHLLFYCRSESVRRDHLLALNGFDEDLDGSHGYQDSDIADRLRKVAGLEFFCANDVEAVIVNPRPYFPHARRERPIDSNREVWERKREAGYPNVRGLAELP